jgi:Zn finger protein HypA/HybF involved in hydrogenase expression
MHELSIAAEILSIVKSKVEQPAIVTKVAVTTSPLSGISCDALQFSFRELCVLEGYTNAVLEISTKAVVMKCVHCAKEYECLELDTFCPVCGRPERDILVIPPFRVTYLETSELENV